VTDAIEEPGSQKLGVFFFLSSVWEFRLGIGTQFSLAHKQTSLFGEFLCNFADLQVIKYNRKKEEKRDKNGKCGCFKYRIDFQILTPFLH